LKILKTSTFHILLPLTILFVLGCEKDDFCIDPVTPNMLIRFYDAADPSKTKPVTNLTVHPVGLEEVYSNVSRDSISIPLNVGATQTQYYFYAGGNQDLLTITYEVEKVFVSRSCGFKAIFNNLSVTSETTNDWILGVTAILENSVSIPTIDNESAAHVQIFH